jgi:hypothetical protein
MHKRPHTAPGAAHSHTQPPLTATTSLPQPPAPVPLTFPKPMIARAGVQAGLQAYALHPRRAQQISLNNTQPHPQEPATHSLPPAPAPVPPHLSKAHDCQHLVHQADAHILGALPLAGLHGGISLGHVASQGCHQRNAVLCCCHCVGCGGVDHQAAVLQAGTGQSSNHGVLVDAQEPLQTFARTPDLGINMHPAMHLLMHNAQAGAKHRYRHTFPSWACYSLLRGRVLMACSCSSWLEPMQE